MISRIFRDYHFNIIRKRINDKFSEMQIRRLDRNRIPDDPDEIRLFTVVRNERLRLPFFLSYYFRQGVNRVFALDNNSNDGTADYLLQQKNTHVFQTKENYKHYWTWINIMLNRYGINHWCLIADADEILIYPHYKTVSLKTLCAYHEQRMFIAMNCFLLDMYSDKPICLTRYEEGIDPLSIAYFFDPHSHYEEKVKLFNCSPPQVSLYHGGMRKRIFHLDSVCLTKFPLFRYNGTMFDSPHTFGAHLIQNATIADMVGVLLHFKYMHDFCLKVREEVKRKQHWQDAVEYTKYADKIIQDPSLNLYDSKSAKLSDEKQLLDLGILKTTFDFERYIKS